MEAECLGNREHVGAPQEECVHRILWLIWVSESRFCGGKRTSRGSRAAAELSHPLWTSAALLGLHSGCRAAESVAGRLAGSVPVPNNEISEPGFAVGGEGARESVLGAQHIEYEVVVWI